MNEFSMDLLDKLSKAAIISSPTRPRLLLESGEVRAIRDRARAIPGFVDGVAGKARDAAEGSLVLQGARKKRFAYIVSRISRKEALPFFFFFCTKKTPTVSGHWGPKLSRPRSARSFNNFAYVRGLRSPGST